jgi:SRSO17 transposase
VGLPTERGFATKTELGLQLIERVRAHQVPFEAIGCDAFYGRDGAFRAELDDRQLEYMADVPANLRVYLSEPVIGLPTNAKGPKASRERVLTPKAVRVDQLRTDPATHWQSVTIRPTERGCLTADFAARRVWAVWQDPTEQFHVRQEWLVIRREADRTCAYALSNAPTDSSLAYLAARKTQRFFVEGAIQNAKSDFGWDESQTIKFRAWHHQLALTILASWFIAETKLDWAAEYARDPALLDVYQVEVLPTLSVANVRSLLRATLPLPQLSTGQAIDLVIQHLDNRVRSRRSRLRNRSGP